jgi:putative ABC transport system permease protein
MIKHYFKIAVRNLFKQKALAFINVFGLSVGLACFILFLLFAVNEFSFDRFHKNKDNLYRAYIHRDAIKGMDEDESCYLPIPLGPAMKQDFPEVQNYARFRDSWQESFVKADDKITRIKVSFADPQFFSMFSFKIIHGNGETALKDPGNIVITRKKALQLFGETNVVGKTVEIKVDDKFDPFTITAVAENIPANSTIAFDILGSFDYYMSTPGGKRGVDNWHRSGYMTYIQLRPGSKLANGSEQFRKFWRKYHPDDEAEIKKANQFRVAESRL